MVVLFDSAAVQAQRIKQLGPAGAAGKDRASVSIAAERLGGKEAGGRNLPKGAGGASATGGAEALGRILEQPQPFPPDEGQNPAVIGGQAEKIDRDDPCRAQPPSRRVRSSASSRAAGSRVKLSSTSTKTGVAPRSATASAVAAKVKAGRNTASPGRAPKASSASVSASVPLAQPSAKRAPRAPGEGVLQRFDLCPADVRPFPQNLSDCGQNSGRKRLILTRKP